VKVISYDRLIKDCQGFGLPVFDNVEVGRQEALGVMTPLACPAAPLDQSQSR